MAENLCKGRESTPNRSR